MSADFYKELIKQGIKELVVKDKTFHFLMPNGLNTELFDIMQDKDIPSRVRMVKALAAVLCDESGKLYFDINNEDDLAVIKAIPSDYIVEIIEFLNEEIFGSKKK